MDKTTLGLLAAIGAAAPLAGAQAAVVTTDEAHRALEANSVAELLDAPNNPVPVLRALDAERAKKAAEGQKLAQIYFGFPHHHHHHWYHHHHHHHWYHHHHHHWYHHHHYYRPYYYEY